MKATSRWIVLFLLVALLGAACGSDPKDTPVPSAGGGSEPIGKPADDPTDEPDEPSGGGESKASTTIEVWFTKGEQLYRSIRTIESVPGVGTAAVNALIAGPSEEEDGDGVSTAVPVASELLGLNIENGVATADLNGEFASGGGSLSERIRLAQLVFTLTQFPTVKSVVLHLDGAPIEAFSGEGIVVDHPLKRREFEEFAPPIVVESPHSGDSVSSPIVVEGTANVFEATVSMRLLDAAGNEIAMGFTTATCGTGCRGDFKGALQYSVDERQAGTLEVFESSAENGEPLHMVRVPVVLKP